MKHKVLVLLSFLLFFLAVTSCAKLPTDIPDISDIPKQTNTSQETPKPNQKYEWQSWEKVGNLTNYAKKPDVLGGLEVIFVDAGQTAKMPDGKQVKFEIYNQYPSDERDIGTMAYVLWIDDEAHWAVAQDASQHLKSAYAAIIFDKKLGSPDVLFEIDHATPNPQTTIYREGYGGAWLEGGIESIEPGFITILTAKPVIHSFTLVRMKYSYNYYSIKPTCSIYECVVPDDKQPLTTLIELSVYALNKEKMQFTPITLPVNTKFQVIGTNLIDFIIIETTDGQAYYILDCNEYFYPTNFDIKTIFSGVLQIG